MVYINQLHLTVVMLLTGRIKLVEKADGDAAKAKAPDKEVVVAQEPEKAAQTCSAEQKTKVKEMIAAYVKTGPLAANNPAPGAAGAPAAGRQHCRTGSGSEVSADWPLDAWALVDARAHNRYLTLRTRAIRLWPAFYCAPAAPSIVTWPVGSEGLCGPGGQRRGRSKHNKQPLECCYHDQAHPRQAQDRPSPRREYLGPSQEPAQPRESRPGQHGERRVQKLSDYGQQLKAKQKLKGYYANLNERQFHKIYVEASRLKGSTSEHVIGLLERRLDAIVYRAKFVPTVFAARQFVSHGHVTVNGRRVTVPSYRCRVGDVVEVKEKSRQLPLVLEAIKSPERDVPDYVEADHNRMVAKFLRVPALSDVPYPVHMEPNLVVEFYSR